MSVDCWNVRSMVSNSNCLSPMPRKVELVVHELKRLGIYTYNQMACPGYSQCRWLSYSIFLYSGRSIGSEKLGVEIMMGGDCKRAWKNGGEQWKTVNSRIIKVQIAIKMKIPKFRHKVLLQY